MMEGICEERITIFDSHPLTDGTPTRSPMGGRTMTDLMREQKVRQATND